MSRSAALCTAITGPSSDIPMDQRMAHLLTKVADLYYLQNRTQAEIAQALKISRPHISRLLKRAREAGIVTISVRPPFGHSTGLAEELGKLFPLREVLLIPAGDAPLARVAEAAASYLAGRISRESVVGVSWGRTVRMIADRVPSDLRRSVEVIPLVGGMGPLGEEIHANEIARRLASRVVGIELNDLPQLPWVFGAAVGVEKAPAVLGALRGGYINVLVTDEPTARACLRLARAG